MLEVEVAANCVYGRAAERLLDQQLVEQPTSPAEHAPVRMQTQELRHRFHERLVEAFLNPAVSEGPGPP